jgi:hypothetical protein
VVEARVLVRQCPLEAAILQLLKAKIYSPEPGDSLTPNGRIELSCAASMMRQPSASTAGAPPAAVEVNVAVFPSTSACPGSPDATLVVEIVAASSSEFHKIQQVRFSKLLNVKI